MKVAIATLAKSPNSGAFLQGYALQEILKKRGLDPYLLDLYDARQKWLRVKSVFFKRSSIDPRSVFFNIKRLSDMETAERHLKFIRSVDETFHATFVGSDEILNVNNRSFYTSKEFFGVDLEATKKYYYAPSAGNAKLDDYQAFPHLVKGISGFKKLSGRDAHTVNILSELSEGREVVRVMDPTFLHDFGSVMEQPHVSESRYIAVYTYGFPRVFINTLKSYAKRKGLKLISFGFFQPWCDYNVNCTPFQFLGAINGAETVVTDTFHGSIFSSKMKKHFICLNAKKNKVNDLLSHIELSSVLFNRDDDHSKWIAEVDYSKYDLKISAEIEKSHHYLNSCIEDLNDY